MTKFFVFVVGSFFIVCMSPYSFANDSVKEHDHGMHRQGETQGLALPGKVDENGIRIIEVKASRYKFEPDPIVVKLGEKVRLVVTSIDVAHGIAISEFKINLSVPAGKTESVDFVADKKGSFQAYCSVYCGPGHAHMHGTLVVQ
jgi:nitrosocyanin